jgi:miaA: tRNA delta(2)-isopentenylpyrophosphate transferase
MKCFINWK